MGQREHTLSPPPPIKNVTERQIAYTQPPNKEFSPPNKEWDRESTHSAPLPPIKNVTERQIASLSLPIKNSVLPIKNGTERAHTQPPSPNKECDRETDSIHSASQ